MKRKDLSLGIWCLFDKGDVRPSQFRKIKAVLPYDNGYFLRDLCQLSEADLLAYDCIDQSFVTLLKSKLAAAGLSLNMTGEASRTPAGITICASMSGGRRRSQPFRQSIHFHSGQR